MALKDILSALEEQTSGEEEEQPTEMKAIWISYLDLVPLLQGKDETSFSQAFSEMAENCRQAGLNTLIVQVRPFGDSFYPSEYFPWSSLTGVLTYDPLEIMTAVAEEKDLSIHAWVNPMRGMTESEMADVPENFPMRIWYDDKESQSTYLMIVDGRIYLNPTSAEVRQLIADGAAELAEKYAVDGIHIDDYFYPPSMDFSVDAASYTEYCENGGSLSQADWRRENTFEMVREMSNAVKEKNSRIVFGVSPRGILSQNLEDIYVDLERLAQEPGCLDYIAPQLYYGFNNESAPFSETALVWNQLAEENNIALIPGLAAYKIGGEDPYAGTGKNEWAEDPPLLAAQIQEARTLSAYGGIMLFRYGSIFQPAEERQAAMKEAMETFVPVLQEEANPAG